MMHKSASGLLEYSTPTTTISARPSLAGRSYSDSTRDTTDIGLGLSATHNAETAILRFSTDTQRDSSFTSELTTTGYLDKKVKRKSDQYSPSLTYIFDSLNSVSLNHSFTDVDYSNGIVAQLFDYEYSNTTISYNRLTDSFGTIGITFTKVSQKIDLLQSKYNTKILQFGFDKDYSETLSYSVYSGIRHYTNDIGYANYKLSDNGWVMNLSGAKQFERSSLNLTLSRDVSPSGGGYMILKNQLNLNFNYRISPQLTTTFDAVALKNIRETENDELNRYYGNADLGLIYNFEHNWNISFHIQHRKNHSEEGVPGKDNVIMFRVSYAGPKTPIKNYGKDTDF